jgi:serine/threonine protein kinase/WD40 repeat protein
VSAENAPRDPLSVRDPVEELAEEFLNRLRSGQRPTLSEFAARAPEHADEIRELFPALVVMEKAGPLPVPPPRPSVVAPLERLGEFRIIRELGRGGMGVVYQAEQEALGRQVALKVLSSAAAVDGHCLLRFRREARAAARLHHTNIVPVFEIGERDGVHFYAMQLIQGQALDEVINELRRLRGQPSPESDAGALSMAAPSIVTSLAAGLRAAQVPAAMAERTDAAGVTGQVAEEPGAPAGLPPVPARERRDSSPAIHEGSDLSTKSDYHFYRGVARIGVQIASALAHAHDQRVLHRDIKPSNLLLDTRGTAWVTDFGLAKEEGEDITRTGDVVGTLRYMAPERIAGKTDARGDIYSLGLTLYELLTLRPAFMETDRVRIINAIANEEPKAPRHFAPHLPHDLETIVLKAIVKDPAARYATARDLEEDLRRFLSDRPIQARRTSTWDRVRRWCRRNPGWAATLAAVLGLLVVLAIGGTTMSLLLRRALSDVQAAAADKTDKLYQAYEERARALRSSGRVGQRFLALDAIREAAKIKITPGLRNEAVAAMVLPDVQIERDWVGLDEHTEDWVVDDSFHRFACIDTDGKLTIGHLTVDGEKVVAQVSVPDQPPFLVLRVSPDGRFLAQGHDAKRNGTGGLRLWRLDLPSPTVLWDEPAKVILSATCFDDEGRLAVATVDGDIRVHGPAGQGPPKRLALGRAPTTLALQPKGKLLAAACGDGVYLLDIETGTPLAPLQLPKVRTWWFGLAWHPAGRLLAASAEDKKIHIWDTATGTEAMAPWEENANGIYMAFNHRGDRLISRSWGGEGSLWDTNSGRLLLTLPTQCMQFSARDDMIGVGRKGRRLQLWRLADGRELRTLRRPRADRTEVIHHPVLDPQTGVLAAACDKGLVFFDLDSGAELAFARFENKHLANPNNFHEQGGWMTSASGNAVFWPRHRDPTRPEQIHIGPPRLVADTRDSGADASPDGRFSVFPQANQVLLLDRQRPGLRQVFGPQDDLRYCAVSPDGSWVAGCTWESSASKCVRIWDVKTGSHALDLPVPGHASARFSPDGRWLATHAAGYGCRLWRVGTWQPGPRFDQNFCWSADGRLLGVHDQLTAIRWVEPDTGRERFRVYGPDGRAYQAALLTDDSARVVATSADLSALYVWDLRLIRQGLRELGMDWDWPELAAASQRPQSPLSVTVDAGIFRARAFESDADAVAAYSVALALQPANPEAYLQRGLAQARLKLAVQAVADYEMFLTLIPQGDPRRPEIHLRRAVNYLDSLKEPQKAVEALREAAIAPAELIPFPEKLAALCNEVAWHAVLQQARAISAAAALPSARKAVDLEPYNFLYQNTLGAVLYRVGRYDEAIRCLEANAPVSRDFAAWDLYFLAMSHHQVGHSDEALRCFERANGLLKAASSLSEGQRRELAGFRAEAEKLLRIDQGQ